MPRTRLWLALLVLCLAVGGAVWFHARGQRGAPELPVYVQGGERMAAGAEIYRRGVDDKPFTYPPFAAVPFVPFARLPADWQPSVWFVVDFALLLLILRWLHVWARSPWPGAGPARPGLLWLLALLVAARHVFSVFENQSHDLLLMAPMVWAAVAWSRGGRSGALGSGVAAGVAAAFKATPLLLLELFVLRRAWLATGALLLTALALSLLPDALFPRQDGGSWLRAFYEVNLRKLEIGGTANVVGAWSSHSILNQSLSGTLTRICSAPPPGDSPFVLPAASLLALSPGALRWVVLVGQLAVLGCIAHAVLRTRRGGGGAALAADGDLMPRRDGLGEVSLILCGMVLLSPQSSKAHFCVLLVPAVFCADRLLRAARRDPVLTVLFGASALLGVGSAKDLLGRDLGNLVLGLGAVTWSTVLLLLAVARALRSGEQTA